MSRIDHLPSTRVPLRSRHEQEKTRRCCRSDSDLPLLPSLPPCNTIAASCVCLVSAGAVSANSFQACPCQRRANCWTLIVPLACCTLDPDDQESPCVTIVLDGGSLAQSGRCKIVGSEECTYAQDCAVKQDFTVTVAKCCSATSLPGGVGTTGSIDCSGAKCCIGDSISVSGGGAPQSASGLGASLTMQGHAYLKCGSPDQKALLGFISCTTSGSTYDGIGNVEVAGFSCGECRK